MFLTRAMLVVSTKPCEASLDAWYRPAMIEQWGLGRHLIVRRPNRIQYYTVLRAKKKLDNKRSDLIQSDIDA